MTCDGLLLARFGGPEGPDDVMPFPEHVTRGRWIVGERPDSVERRHAGSPCASSQRIPSRGAQSHDGSTVAAYTNS